MSKTKIIKEYLEANPTHTWKDAKDELEPKGITGSYYAMQKSKFKNGEVKTELPKYENVEVDLRDFAKMVRSLGGIEKAQELLDQLKDYQVG